MCSGFLWSSPLFLVIRWKPLSELTALELKKWNLLIVHVCFLQRETLHKQTPAKQQREQARACGTKIERHPLQSPLNQQHYGEICSIKSAYCQPAEGFIIRGWKTTQNAQDIGNADEWLICCYSDVWGDFEVCGVFAPKVIYESTLTSQRVNNTFPKAGSCKLWRNKDKEQTDRLEFSLYLDFHSSFLNPPWKSLKLPMMSRCYILKSMFWLKTSVSYQ